MTDIPGGTRVTSTPNIVGATSTAAAAPAPAAVDQQLANLLDRAGFTKDAAGNVIVSDVAAVAKTGEVGAAGRMGAMVAELGLPPVMPPRAELTPELRQGAESFAANIDSVFDELALRPDVLAAMKAGDLQTVASLATSANSSAGGLSALEVQQLVRETEGDAQAAFDRLGIDMNALPSGVFRGFGELTADVMIAIFLKLNMTDPNNSPEMHFKLQKLASDLRQQSIDVSQQKARVATEQLQEAQAYAEKAEIISQVVTVVMIAVTIALTVVTFGAGLPLAVVLAATAIGAVVGQASGGSAIEGAGIGAAVGSLGVSVGAMAATHIAKTAAERAAKEAAQAAIAAVKEGQKLTTEMVQQAVSKAIESLGEKATQLSAEQTRAVIEKTMEKVLQESSVKMSSELSQAVSNKTLGELLRATADDAAKSAVQQVGDDAVKSATHQATSKSDSLQSSDGFRLDRAHDRRRLMKWIRTSINATGQIANSYTELQAYQRTAVAEEAKVDSKRWQLHAQMLQEQVQEEGDTMKMIIEAKNATVDAVLRMLNAQLATQNKVMSAGMVR